MNAFVAHVKKLWPRWWYLPPLPFIAMFLVDAAIGAARWEHVLLALLVPALAYGNTVTKKLCVGFYPMGLVALLYDAMRFVKNVGLS